MLISLNIDGLLVAGSSTDLVVKVKQDLSKRFSMVGCGKAEISLGLEIACGRSKLTVKIVSLPTC